MPELPVLARHLALMDAFRRSVFDAQWDGRKLLKQYKGKARAALKRELRSELMRRRPKERISPEEREMRLEELGRRCLYCLEPAVHLDHVVPLAKGGAHAIWNLVPACLNCNMGKRASNPLTWAERHGVRPQALALIADILNRHRDLGFDYP